MARPDSVCVSVVYALPDRQSVVTLTVPAQTRVRQVVLLSGLLERFPEIGAGALACAIYGRAVPLDEPVREGDRIEILRPLKVDPKEARRQAAAHARRR